MKPWERQPGETSKAFAAFCAYLDLGVRRSFDAAYRQHTGNRGATRAPGYWNRWTQCHGWVRRAEAYDAHLFDEKVEARAKVRALALQEVFDATSDTVAVLIALTQHEDIERPSQAAKVRFAAAKELLGYIGITASSKVEVSGPDGGPVEIDSKQAAIERARLIDAMMASVNLTDEQVAALDADLDREGDDEP